MVADSTRSERHLVRSSVVVIATFLVVSGFLNGPWLHQAARRDNNGWVSDVAWRVTAPLEAISSALQGDELRRQLSAVGTWAHDDGRSTTIIAGDGPAEIKMLFLGDSLMRELAPTVIDDVARNGARVTADTLARPGTGLTTPELYDWVTVTGAKVDQVNPDVVVILLGTGWRGSKTTGANGETLAVGSVEWVMWYEGLVGEVIDAASGRGATVVWVTTPPLADDEADRLRRAGSVALRAAADQNDVIVVDAAEALGVGEGFQLTERVDGLTITLREEDGVHLSDHGVGRVANVVANAVGISAR